MSWLFLFPPYSYSPCRLTRSTLGRTSHKLDLCGPTHTITPTVPNIPLVCAIAFTLEKQGLTNNRYEVAYERSLLPVFHYQEKLEFSSRYPSALRHSSDFPGRNTSLYPEQIIVVSEIQNASMKFLISII